MCLQFTSFENSLRNREIACDDNFSFSSKGLFYLLRTLNHFHKIENCSLQTLILEESKICHLRMGLTMLGKGNTGFFILTKRSAYQKVSL